MEEQKCFVCGQQKSGHLAAHEFVAETQPINMSYIDKHEKEFFERFGANKIWVTPSKDNVETVLEMWAFLKSSLEESRNSLLDEIEKWSVEKRKVRQFPLAEKVADRVYDCDVNAYNQALSNLQSKLLELRK